MATCLSIVLVEDHDDLREVTADILRAQGHRVLALSCAEEVEDKVRGESVDLFLIDLNLPGEDGFSLSRRIRQVQPLVGIAIISARTHLLDKVESYDCGADMYLCKPVPFEELSAAISSFARRRQAHHNSGPGTLGPLSLQQRELSGPAGIVRLSGTEAALLTSFARAPSGRLENWQLLELFGIDSADAGKTRLEVRITRLRKKLSQAGAPGHCLEAVRNIGYQLQVPVQVMQ
jgi:DNA-binding response OmpR family regulator